MRQRSCPYERLTSLFNLSPYLMLYQQVPGAGAVFVLPVLPVPVCWFDWFIGFGWPGVLGFGFVGLPWLFVVDDSGLMRKNDEECKHPAPRAPTSQPASCTDSSTGRAAGSTRSARQKWRTRREPKTWKTVGSSTICTRDTWDPGIYWDIEIGKHKINSSVLRSRNS